MAKHPELNGIHHITNICTDIEKTREFYEDILGFYTVKMTENYDDPGTAHYYFSPTPEGEPGTVITYFEYPGLNGQPGGGASHHFALGVKDEGTLERWQEYLLDKGIDVSPIRNRT